MKPRLKPLQEEFMRTIQRKNHTDKIYDDTRHIIWAHDFNFTL